jgi:hypothetical protein
MFSKISTCFAAEEPLIEASHSSARVRNGAKCTLARQDIPDISLPDDLRYPVPAVVQGDGRQARSDTCSNPYWRAVGVQLAPATNITEISTEEFTAL